MFFGPMNQLVKEINLIRKQAQAPERVVAAPPKAPAAGTDRLAISRAAGTARLRMPNTPEEIAQVPGKNTCVAALAQRALAENDPPAYAALVDGLMARGEAELPTGEKVSLSPENKAYVDRSYPDKAARENAMVQAALMEHATDGTYRLATDTSKAADGTVKTKGLDEAQAEELTEAAAPAEATESAEVVSAIEEVDAERSIFRQIVDAFRAGDRTMDAAAAEVLKAQLDKANAAGKELSVNLSVGETAHQFQLKAVSDTEVTLEDGSGKAVTMTLEEFRLASEAAEGQEVGNAAAYSTAYYPTTTRAPRPAPTYSTMPTYSTTPTYTAAPAPTTYPSTYGY